MRTDIVKKDKRQCFNDADSKAQSLRFEHLKEEIHLLFTLF